MNQEERRIDALGALGVIGFALILMGIAQGSYTLLYIWGGLFVVAILWRWWLRRTDNHG
jgi:hypothetical protein